MRPVHVPARSARSRTVRGPRPDPVIAISGDVSPSPVPFAGSLLVPVTLNTAMPESTSALLTVATGTNPWFGGQRTQLAGGMPEITGPVLSIFTAKETDLGRPTPLVA